MYKSKTCKLCKCLFSPTSGSQLYCILCGSITKKDRAKQASYKRNKTNSRREYMRVYDKKRRLNNIIYRNNHKEYVYKWRKEKYHNNIIFKLRLLSSNIIRNYLIKKDCIKYNKSIQYIGCSIEFLRQYLEKQFKPWMTWDNYGKYNGELNYGWDIDHIIPLSSAKTEEELIKLFHYTNLQPLDSFINRHIKSNKII